MNTTPNVHAEAAVIAADSYTNNFSSRRGTGLIGLGQCRKGSFYLYDNNPYGKDKLRPLDADGTRRAREIEKVAAFLAARGCKLVGNGSYPNTGDSRGYSVALVFLSKSPSDASGDLQAAGDYWLDCIAPADGS